MEIESHDDRPRMILLVACPDQPGIVAAVAGFVFERGGNIVHAEQHTDHHERVFFQRVELEVDDRRTTPGALADAFASIARRFEMRWQLHATDSVSRMAILVSRQTHCLTDLLWRWQSGELADVAVPLVVSNHADARDMVEFIGPRFVHLPAGSGASPERDALLRALFAEHEIDVVVLARFMQILGPELVELYEERVINIHHSFLPAFAGARPYHQAHQRGVKLIGATAHYATAVLDDGPIIDQDVIRVSHRDTVVDLVRKGRDLERLVLARAVRAHLEHRILTFADKTVVFD